MRRDLDALRSQPYDLLVVGGGINGAGIARDAAMRGLRVALIEQGDFGSGTSSRSSKLIHGGLRYLEQFHFRLVREASLERRILLRIAPHLVRPLPFILPVYQGDRRGLRTVQLGMCLYDVLSMFHNRRHRMLSPAETLELEPRLRSEGLLGAALYYDAQMDDARLCLANIASAVAHGAAAANYVRAVRLLRAGGRLTGAEVRDGLTRDRFEVRAGRVVNATGPWLDQLCQMDVPEPSKVRLSKGVHVVVPPLTNGHAITAQSSDNRVIFILPWNGSSLVGTTDSDYRGRPEAVAPAADEIAFLLSEVQSIVPSSALTPGDVLASFAGLRALVRNRAGRSSVVSREDRIYESPDGLISIAGGKFTTYRLMAKRVVDRISCRPCRTHLEQLPAAGLRHLAGIEALTRHAVENEMAFGVSDVLRRRTQIALGPGQGIAEAGIVATAMGKLLGWDEYERNRQIDVYLASVTVGDGAPAAGG